MGEFLRRANRLCPTCFNFVQERLDILRNNYRNDPGVAVELAHAEKDIAVAKLTPFVGGLIGFLGTSIACSVLFNRPETNNDPVVFWFALVAILLSAVTPAYLLAVDEKHIAQKMSMDLTPSRFRHHSSTL